MTVEQIKQFLIGSVVPVIAGSLATWVTGTKVLAIFGITKEAAAAAIVQVLVFGITAGLTFLVSHHILLGHYAPAAKAAARKGL
jgi:hypothetical protein